MQSQAHCWYHNDPFQVVAIKRNKKQLHLGLNTEKMLVPQI